MSQCKASRWQHSPKNSHLQLLVVLLKGVAKVLQALCKALPCQRDPTGTGSVGLGRKPIKPASIQHYSLAEVFVRTRGEFAHIIVTCSSQKSMISAPYGAIPSSDHSNGPPGWASWPGPHFPAAFLGCHASSPASPHLTRSDGLSVRGTKWWKNTAIFVSEHVFEHLNLKKINLQWRHKCGLQSSEWSQDVGHPCSSGEAAPSASRASDSGVLKRSQSVNGGPSNIWLSWE